MKIVQVINSISAGGAEVFACQLSVELVRQGNDVTLITCIGYEGGKGISLDKYLLENGVKVIHFTRGRGLYRKFIKPFFKIKKSINTIKPEIIHSHLQLSDVYVSFVNLFVIKKYRIVRTIHNRRRPRGFNHLIDEFFYRKFNKNIACSDFVKENYVDEALRKYMVSIPNGIDLENIESISNSKNELRKELGISTKSTVFINIGSMYLSKPDFISKKNQQFIIDSVSLISKEKDFLVLFLGDGPLRETLELSCIENGVNKYFRFEGNVVNPYKYILASDFCLMPSLDEGLPIALIEAVCAGLYSITSNINAFEPFKSQSVCMLETFHTKEFGEVLTKVITNKNDFIKLGEANRIFFNNKFSINSVANSYIKLYNNF